MFRGALAPESRTIVRLLNSLEYQTADADGRLLSVDLLNLEDSFGVMIAQFVAELIPALRDGSDPAPFSVIDFEDVVYQFLRYAISLALYNTRILVLDFRSAALQLANSHQYSLEDIQWLKAGNDYRNTKPFGDWLIFFITHHGANMSWSQKSLYAVYGRLQN